MTRINIGIPVKRLPSKLLLAEAREIKRIPNVILKGKADFSSIPSKFKLGEGHVKFFYDKQLYLKNRYIEIFQECKHRNFNVTNFISSWDNIPNELMNDYTPTISDIKIILERFKEKKHKLC